jgi:Fe-Mn family superoxide dismutase
MSQYNLPDLPYDFGALEPHISGQLRELHHGKHHRAYVEGANQTSEKLLEARGKQDFAQIVALEHALAFHLSGHVLHSLFWQNLAPPRSGAGGKPTGALAQALDRDFGSFDAFKKQLTQTAVTVMGSGWAALVWDPVAKRLLTAQFHDHQSEVAQGSIPLLVLDAWEHAYYLQYRNEKAKYFEAVWNVWNWSDVARRLELAGKVDLGLGSKGSTT